MFRIASKYFLKANPKPYYLFKKNLRGIASSVQEKSTYKLNIRMQELFRSLHIIIPFVKERTIS